MIIELTVPSPGESITEVQLANWLKSDGDFVEKDAEIAEIDSDKATLPVNAPESGKLHILVQAGETVKVGTVIARIDTLIQPSATNEKDIRTEAEPSAPEPDQIAVPQTVKKLSDRKDDVVITPLARKIMEENNLSTDTLKKRLRIKRKDVDAVLKVEHETANTVSAQGVRETERKKLTTLRLKLSERLVAVKNQTAMLTTFNEVNMSAILQIKKQFNDAFKEKYGVGIGFMSFFTKAATIALQKYPQVNAMIDGEDLVYHKYADVGIAVSAPKGLVVPVIRNAEALSLAEIEIRIKELALKARENRITLEEMTGGTFTITNGGVFGSMMSTPILNPPQSAILGMHNIVERPVAQNGQVVIAPIMYLALSYDHRVIDGRESVSFLVTVKELLESPTKMLFQGEEPAQMLLGI